MGRCYWGGGIHGNIDTSTKAQRYRRFGIATCTKIGLVKKGEPLLLTTLDVTDVLICTLCTTRAAWHIQTSSKYWLYVLDLMYGFWNR